MTVARGLTDAAALLRAERDENVERKDLSPLERVALGKRLEPLAEAEAKERQGTRTDLEPSAKLAESKTRDQIGEAVGMSGKSYEKAKAVVEEAGAVIQGLMVSMFLWLVAVAWLERER